jgi:hypothetical protein
MSHSAQADGRTKQAGGATVRLVLLFVTVAGARFGLANPLGLRLLKKKEGRAGV